MTKNDRKLYEDDTPIGIDWEQLITEIIIIGTVIFILWIACGIESQAKEPVYVTYQQAGCNLTKYLLINAEADETAKENFYKACKERTARAIIKRFNKEQAQKRNHKENVDLMARLIWNECGILGEKAMYNAGSVVLNRVNSDRFPNTIGGVIYQKDPIQYACAWNGRLKRETPDIAYEIAEDLITNGSKIPANVVYQAQFRQGTGVYEIIGNTYFCYL